MESENKGLENKKKDKIPFALRNKKTGKVLFCVVVAVFTELAANNYKVEIELKDKNGVTRKIFFPLSNTCDLGKIKLIYEKSEEAMKLLDLIGISRYNLESSGGWKSSLKDKKNIYDEYGIEEPSSIAGNVVSGLYELNSNKNNPVNKNLDISYGGYEDWDDQSTALNDFWHRFYEKICTEKKYQWMKFYRNLNMTLYETDLYCHGVLTTALSNGNIETLRKEIFNFGHFVGPDSYIYDFNEIYPNDDINLYKNYLGFILWNKLPSEKNKTDYANEILNYISEKNEDLKKFITENQVRYNDEDGRFEMITSEKNTHDANAWIYSAFFPTPSENYPKYSFYKCKSYLPEEYQRNMETKKINDYGPVWSNKFKLENQKILQALKEAEAKGEVSNARKKFVKNVAKSEEWRKENFNFINNTAAYFKRDFNFEDVAIFNEEEKKKLETDLKTKSIDLLLNRFFKNPTKVKTCLEDNENHEIDAYWCADYFEYSTNNYLSDNGEKFADIIFNRIKETPIAKERDEKDVKNNVEYGFARALFECLQVNGDYDKFIEELRINLSFYIRNNIGSTLHPEKMKLKTEFRQKFVKFKTEIQKLKVKQNEAWNKVMTARANHKHKDNNDCKKCEECIELSEEANKINSELEQKQKEMDKEFFSVKQFDFLKKEKIINENDFAQTNSEVLEIAKNKINALNLKELMPEKKMSVNDTEELKNKIYNRFEDTIKNYPNISYDEFVSYLNKEILICKYNGLEETLFNMIWEFELELKNKKDLKNGYWDSMVVMRLYHLVQHFFHTAGILSDVKELTENDMREIALNMEDIRFYLKTNPNKLVLDKNSAIESLIIRLFKGTSLGKNIPDYIDWFKNGVNDFCQMTTEVKHITQSNGVSLATKNRRLENGFFVNCDNGLIKNLYVPLQTIAKCFGAEFKPNIDKKVELVDPNEKCDLTLNDDEWEILDEDQIFELSDKSFDILINTATYITPDHLKKLMDCWKSEDYVVTKMGNHLLNTEAKKSIFGLINKGVRVDNAGKNKNVGNNHRKELFPMIKELYKNCQQTSLENAIEFLEMQKECNYEDYYMKMSLEDAKKHFDFAVESMNKIWFKASELNINSSYSSGIYCNLLNQFNAILGEFERDKNDLEYNSAIEAQKKAMDSHPELILALYVLYYFGTKKYDWKDPERNRLRNIKNYEEKIFKFKNWKDFLNSISSDKYNRTNKYLRKMAEDFCNRRKKKDPIIQTIIDNYKIGSVFSNKGSDKEIKTKNGNLIENKNKINQTSNTKKCSKSKIALVALTVLIFLLLIVAIISGNPIFIKAMIAITLIYVVLIISFICYRDRVSKNKTGNRITLDKNMQRYGYDRGINRSLNYESEEKTNLTQQYTINQENKFPS